jgi:hypothetical protein
MEPAGQQNMADLATKERHRFRGVHREAQHRTGRAIDPARQINRIDAWRRVHSLDHGARNAFDRPIEASPEQGVDEHVGRHQRRGLCSRRRTLPTLRSQGGIPPEPVRVADQKDPHPVSALGQEAGCNKSIAPVVARPCNHGDVQSEGMSRGDGVGNGATGVFHQLDAGNPARDRVAVGLCHFGGGEQFDHCRRRLMPRRWARDPVLFPLLTAQDTPQ